MYEDDCSAVRPARNLGVERKHIRLGADNLSAGKMGLRPVDLGHRVSGGMVFV